MSERYGIYFMPADTSQLARFGTAVLERSASGEPVSAPADEYPGRAELIANARHYGFHATLKAPFEPQPGVTAERLQAALSEVGATLAAVSLAGLAPDVTAGFCALVLPAAAPADQATRELAGLVVEAFEPFRAPLGDAERQRRQPARLSAREREYLERYGYPYVHDTFRFHMTLSASMPAPQPYLRWLRRQYSIMVTEDCCLDRLALAWQPDRQTPFRRIAEVCLDTRSNGDT